MKVKKIMTTDVGFCFVEENLSRAVEIMRERDCGVIPVIDSEMNVAGMITDRDISIALATRNKKPSEVKISNLIGGKVFSCLESDDAEDALKKMRRSKVKRLPVVNRNGALTGILSISDLILKAPKLKKKIFSALKVIARPRRIVLQEIVEEEKA